MNTGGKPLDIQMSVMNARVFATMRSGFQVAAFLLGLLLIWRQRHNRNSFFITLGAALAIGAVAELLIAGRVLDLALIVAAPVLALAVLIVVLRKIWPKKAAARKAASRKRNDPRPPAPPIVPPVAASIALLLLLAHSALAQDPARWMDCDTNFALATDSALARDASASPIASLQSAIRNPQSAITTASYTGVIGEKVAQFDGSLLLTSVSTNQIAAALWQRGGVAGFFRQVGRGPAAAGRRHGCGVSCPIPAKPPSRSNSSSNWAAT